MAQLVWLITGCSSGLGQEFVSQILSRGDKVIATARRLESESIQSLQSAGASILKLDVTDEAAAINNVINEAIKIHGRIDVLVNNAGFVTQGAVEELRYVL
jgi:NADP-dependent 3-hydroxy acid dehydrogenase YdfG